MNIRQIVDSFKSYLGYDSLISQKDLDQGDTAQRCGHALAYLKLIDEKDFLHFSLSAYYNHVFSKLEVSPGVYTRSSNPSYWGSNPNNLSRDQRSGLESAMAAFDDTKKLQESKIYLLKRFGFHQNTHKGTDDPKNKWKIPDPVTPSEIRLWNTRPRRYLRRLFLDSALLVDLMLRDPNNYDTDNMLAVQMLISYVKYPTFLSKMAMKRYIKTGFIQNIYDYHRVDGHNNGCFPLALLCDYAYWKLVPGYQSKSKFE